MQKIFKYLVTTN